VQSSEAEDYSSGLSLDYLGQPSIGVGADGYGQYVGGGTSAYFSDMLGNKALAVQLQAQGTFKDIGGTAFYADFTNRWNWGLGGGRIPYLLPFFNYGSDAGGDYLGFFYYRLFVSTAMGQLQYPFSSTQRVEFGIDATRYSYDLEVDKFYTDFSTGVVYGRERESIPGCAESADAFCTPEPLVAYTGSAAVVGDNAFFGFVSPIRGERYRFEVQQTLGSMDYTTVVADYRRYFQPSLDLTIGLRALHFGRYGIKSTDSSFNFFGGGGITPLFLGYETLVRGYAVESIDAAECQGDGLGIACPAVDRLIGNRIAVSSMEVRIPLLGVEQYGLINFPFVPTELVLFTDAGVAWDSDKPPVLEWSRSGSERVPVVASGVSARMNILGILIFEAYYAYPWQRPLKGWHWGFQLAPGW
jgi:hypothetical protein